METKILDRQISNHMGIVHHVSNDSIVTNFNSMNNTINFVFGINNNANENQELYVVETSRINRKNHMQCQTFTLSQDYPS